MSAMTTGVNTKYCNTAQVDKAIVLQTVPDVRNMIHHIMLWTNHTVHLLVSLLRKLKLSQCVYPKETQQTRLKKMKLAM